jgi:hypothetical protein
LYEEDEQFILQATQEILDDVGERQTTAAAANNLPVPEVERKDIPRIRLLACPSRDEFDELALRMLQQMLNPDLWEVKVAAAENLTSEVIQMAEEWKPAVFCVGCLPPGGLARTRYLCKRLRMKFPEVKIVVGRWGTKTSAADYQQEFTEAGADNVETTLQAAKEHLQAWWGVLGHQPATKAAEPPVKNIPAASRQLEEALV